MSNPIDLIASLGVVPVIAIERVEDAVPLADALLEGGLPVAEITFRTEAAADVLAAIRDARPELCIGAGTILTQPILIKQSKAAHVLVWHRATTRASLMLHPRPICHSAPAS